jgi:Helix-turn-helix domain
VTAYDNPFQGPRTSEIPSIGTATVGSLEERPDADFLTLSEVADILRVPVNTLRWWRQQGTGPRYFKIGRRLVTTVGDLKTWVEEQKSGTSPDAA